MENRKELLVGLLVLVGIIVAGITILTYGNFEMAKNNYTLKAKFKDVNNLEIGTPVILNGVKIGKVQSIYIEDDYVVVEMAIKNSVKLRKGAKISINLKGLIGDLTVKVYNVGKGNEYYSSGDIIEGADPISLDVMIEKGYDLMLTMENVTNAMKDLDLESSVKDSQEILKNIRESSDKLSGTLDSAKKLLDNSNKLVTENREDLRESVKASKELVGKIDMFVNKNEGDIKEIIQNLKVVSQDIKQEIGDNKESLQKSLKNFEIITEKTSKIVEKLEPKDVQELKENLLQISRDMKDITKRLNEATSPEKSKVMKESIDKVVKNAEKVKSLIDNKITLEAQIEVDKDSKFSGNARAEILNNSSNIYLKFGKENVDNDFGKNTITIGRDMKKFKYGGGLIRDKAGVEAAYRLNDKVSINGEYYDFKNGKSFVGMDYEINKYRLYFRYDLSEYYRAGIGYKF